MWRASRERMISPRPRFLAASLVALFAAGCSENDRTVTSWSRSIEATAAVQGIGVDAAGGVTIAGSFSADLDLGAGRLPWHGANDAFFGRLDGSGQTLWGAGTGDESDQQARAVAVTPAGDAFVAGTFSGQMDLAGNKLLATSPSAFLTRLSPDGRVVWSKQIGDGVGSTVTVGAVAVDATGSAVIGGSFTGTLDLGGGQLVAQAADASFVARFDGAGHHVFSLRLAGGSNEITSLALAADGSVALGGTYSGSVGIGGPLLTAKVPSGFVALLAPTGQPQLLAPIGDSELGGSSAGVTAVAFDADQDLVASGAFHDKTIFGAQTVLSYGPSDAFLALFSGVNGAPLWIHHFGQAFTADEKLAVAPSGEILLAGNYSGTGLDVGDHALPAGDLRSGFFARVSPAGDVIDARALHSDENDVLLGAMAIDPAGGVVLGGLFAGQLAFGDQTLQGPSGTQSLFLLRAALP
jgi:hypothetical protein